MTPEGWDRLLREADYAFRTDPAYVVEIARAAAKHVEKREKT